MTFSIITYPVSRNLTKSGKQSLILFNSVVLLLFLFQAMDTSNPAAFVNAQLLPNFIGKKVRTVVKVNQSDGVVTTATSTDDQQLNVKGVPQVPLMNYIEIIGIAESNNSINAEICTDFGNTFGTNHYRFFLQLFFSIHVMN